MNRRGFFGVLAGVAATAALDPERLLWVSGKKLISIAAPYPTVDQLLDEAIRRLGYIRPLRRGELANTFMEMTAMVEDRWELRVGRILDCSRAVREASFSLCPSASPGRG